MTWKPIPLVVQEHAEEAAILHNLRRLLVHAPHVKLDYLRRLDDRVAAHIDGIAVAGDYGSTLCESALENPGSGELFVTTVSALEARNARRLEKVLAVARAVPEAQDGLIFGLGWVSARALQGIVGHQLASEDAFLVRVGIAACAQHGVDPGRMLATATHNDDVSLRARALRCMGEVGRLDLLPACNAHLNDDGRSCAFWAAWSAVLLGNRGAALESLERLCGARDADPESALRIVLMTLPPDGAHELLTGLARVPGNERTLIAGAGLSGDPRFVPWLISRMTNDHYARLAGEAFTLITGADFEQLDLERMPSEGFETGPSDDPNDPNVDMDSDEGLPWPDQWKVQAWWDANNNCFENGQRYFMGAPVTREHCIDVLKNGYQRQRILAAHYLCLLNPGTPLFNTSAPAWRQQKLLAQMT